MSPDADRDREDRQAFQRLNILFQGRASEWPVHHLKTFQKIAVLGSTRYSTYCTDVDSSNSWKHETKARAHRLVDTVSRLTRNHSSEIQWRLDIEKLVYKRFELDIKWYIGLLITYYGIITDPSTAPRAKSDYGGQKLRQSLRVLMR
jgi:hypothetical protein